MSTPAAKVLPVHLNAAIVQMAAMSLAEKEMQFDIIYLEQPNLLASVIVQQQMGNTLEQMDVLPHILLVVHLSLHQANVKLEAITEDK